MFFLIFLFIYGALHLYAFIKARRVFALGKTTGALVMGFMLLMMATPVLVRMLERNDKTLIAKAMAMVGYGWMGLLIFFVCVAIVVDAYGLALRLATRGQAGGLLASFAISSRKAFWASLGVALLLVAYSHWEARDIRTDRIELASPKIPAAIRRLRIVQISDVHVGLLMGAERLAPILRAVREAQPDVLVSTGDLVDGQTEGLDNLAKLWQEIQPRYGKYAVTGNHEFYVGLTQALDFTKKAGFTILEGKGLALAAGINLIGVDDATGIAMGARPSIPERDILQEFSREHYTILLKHRPVVDKEALGLFDLQLSGHTHKGQIFPFSIVTWLYYPVHFGILNLIDGGYLYVSRGCGTWGPSLRFLSPPQVVIIDLVPTGT